jgi:tetratricopeptide (TPR) repeat protein
MSEEKKDALDINIEESINTWSQKIEENKKSYSIILGSIVGVLALYFGYTKLYIAPMEEEARKEIFYAEKYLATDSLDKAINGDANHLGFEEIINRYGSTPTGNLANYYMGVCLLKKGEFEKSIEYLSDYSGNDEMLAPIALGGIGDAYMELGKVDKAVNYYNKAANSSNNNFTSPIYLMRAALAYESLGKPEKALDIYETLKKEYSSTTEGRDADKYIARVNQILGK